MRRLEEYCDEAGQTKTMAVERIVAAFLDKRDAKAQDEKLEKKFNPPKHEKKSYLDYANEAKNFTTEVIK